MTLPDPLRVETEAGRLRGTRQDGVRIFRGIPFAAPPVGDLRWRPPGPVRPWTGLREATAFGPDCPQRATLDLGSRAPGQDEDCLSLNIWTPARGADEGLPVMVWIFGGSFVFGTASEERGDGMTFARDGIVHVTLNYRVGLFGFLAHPALTAEQAEGFSGNWGLLDQIAALRWIQRNIARFGGDPNRVTAFGVSAGAASIAALMTSPLAEGLFQRAILQSPGSFRPLSTLAEAEQAGLALGQDIAALRALPAAEILARQGLLVPPTRGLTTPRVLRPIADGHVIPGDERAAFRAGRCLDIPLIVGSVADEGSNAVATWPVRDLAAYEALLAADFGPDRAAALALWPATRDAEVPAALAEAFGDTQFTYAAWGLAAARAARRPGTAWRYLLTRRRPGAGPPRHSEDVSYVFDRPDLPPRDARDHRFDAQDIAIARAMHAAWVRFARDGSPAGAGLDWPACGPDGEALLEFGDTPRPRQGWRGARMRFLDRFFDSRATA